MKKFHLLSLILIFCGNLAWSQCDPSVPLYVIDLSNNPDTTWVLYEEDAQNRQGLCCSATGNENCIQFEITLNENVAGVYFNYDGAPAYGSLNWQIDCGPEYNLRDTICINGGGTVTLTFCKAGSDNGNYTLISVPQPTFPDDQFVPMNCQRPVQVLGVVENTVQWQSISPGTPGQYNYLLNCTNCLDPVYTPDPTGPTEVEFKVCGYPILDYCVGNYDFCDTVKFTNLDSILMDVSPINPSFCSGGTVDLIGTATGGDGNFTFYWYDNALNLIHIGDTLTVSSAGSYTCEARDGNYDPIYCDDFKKTVNVVESFPPAVSVSSTNGQVYCGDLPDADILYSVVNASGGLWSGGAGTFATVNDSVVRYTPTQAEIAAGSVILTLTSTGGGASCSDDSDAIELFFLDTIQSDLDDFELGCFGSTSTVTPNVTGGTGTYTYSWTNGKTTPSAILGTGTHCVTITDDNGCESTECFTITSPPQLNLSMSSTPASTDGGSDGTATANPSGGTPPYTYSWDTGGTNQTESGLSYGVYTVTVTDDNGCTRTASVVVNEPRCAGFFVNTSATDVLCFSDSTGSATVTPSGGAPTYTYSWNDYAAQSTATANNLPTGVYEVTVTDGNGCIAIGTASVFEPSVLLNTMTHSDVTIQGGSDGSAQANTTGGAGSYNYSWSTTETSVSIGSLSAGWYEVEISDANGCTLNDSVFVNEPPCDQFYLYVSTTSPLCNGDLTGSASLSIQNGVAPYSIDWSTGQTDVMNISDISGGIHSVEVTDAQGCYTFLNFGVSEPSPLSIGLIPTPSTCSGFNNGTIDMSISGGTYPYYYYNWSNGATTEDLINLPPGSYSITVTDENGCQASNSTSLTDPAPLSYTNVVQNVTCFDGTDGSIDITPTGGTIPYTYDWSNGATTQDLSGIDVGGYILNIIDGNFCDLDNPGTILVEQPLKVEADTIIISCPAPGVSQAQVDVTPVGGNADYSISSDGGVTYGASGNYSLMLDLGQGYDIVVSDVNNCLSDSFHIEIDPDLVLTLDLTNATCYNFSDGACDLTVEGGAPPYVYQWTNPGTSTEDILDIPAGDYTVTVTDNKGCSKQITGTVEEPDSLTVSGDVVNPSCYLHDDGGVSLNIGGGTEPYASIWSNGMTGPVISGMGEGTYDVNITDANGCTQTGSYVITQPDSLEVLVSSPLNFHGHNIDLYGGNDGVIYSTVNGGTGPYYYNWSNGEVTEVLYSCSAGSYSVEVEDSMGCKAVALIVLTQPMNLDLPSAFSPNNDNANDKYVIRGIEAYPDNRFIVTNRWGNVVYEKEGYANTWGGENKQGNILPDGVYFVILEINGGDIKRDTYVHIKTH